MMKKQAIAIMMVLIMLTGGIFPDLLVKADAINTYVINGKTIKYNDISSSPDECWAYANAMYKIIWDENFSNEFGSSDNLLHNLTDSQLTLTTEHLKEYVSSAALGSCLRICNSEYLHGTDGWGHSQIIVQKDGDGFTVFQGGLENYPYCDEHYYTWASYINSFGYQYIKPELFMASNERTINMT